MSVPGIMGAAVMGAFGISDEHRKFLSSGYRCPSCNASNTSLLGMLTTNSYSAEGKKLALIAGGAVRGDTAECPKCSHRWKVYDSAVAAPPPGDATMEIVETDRSEEPFGDDHRVIDNTRSSGSLTRTFTFTKVWTKTCDVQTEKAVGAGGEFSLGIKDAAALKVSSEEKLRTTYGVTHEAKETYSEQVTCNVDR